MITKTQPIDTLQIIFTRLSDAENNSLYPEFNTSIGYSMAIKDLASILGIDPNKYGTKSE